EETFEGSAFCGTMRIDGKPYFEYARRVDDMYVASLIPHSSVYKDRVPISLMTAFNSFVLLLILSLSFVFTTDEEEALYSVDINGNRSVPFAFLDLKFHLPKKRSTASSTALQDSESIPWAERSAEQKLRLLLSIVGTLSLIYVGFTLLYADRIFRHDSIVLYILSGAWNRGLNIFALSACGLVFLGTVVVILLIQIPFRLLISIMGARTETICRLLLSVLKYGLGIGMLFFCLYLVGVNSTGLIASASVLSLVIGFGAQSLITDIIAGLFIVFEGSFRVGDIITVQGFRGTVMDISLRTTKVLGVDGNISVFNNNDIKGVLNMTRHASYAAILPSIEYGQDIDYVEAILGRELPKLRQRDHRILDGPNYLGIQALGESGVTLLIVAKCNEEDIKGFTRSLNRAILKIFYQNGINVPFPNVTISQLDPEGRKTMADLRDTPMV
ncbi:MAG: mechanosensitive ion channel family protein, partial [Oscillospiraceae bacterium]|nr:mechanosensitive ion channel family protein [Oscillospiraceae bacterium]